MGSELKAHVAFHLTGKRTGAGLESFEGFDVRPALLARYRDLTTLRYDFPLVLLRDGRDSTFVQSLSGIVEEMLAGMTPGDDGGRVIQQVLRLEQEVRALVAHGFRGMLSALWDTARDRVGARIGTDELLGDCLDRARAALQIDGEVVDCDAALPAKLVTHAWRAVQEKNADQLGADVRRLASGLSNILRADVAHSTAGQGSDNLKASVGPRYEDAFDFDAMSRMLTTVAPKATVSDIRRRRIRSLISVLESHDFSPDAYFFTSGAAALGAYRARLPKVIAIARAMAMAELEIEGEYKESTHDALFAELGVEGVRLDAQVLARFPDCLVCVNAGTMEPSELATLVEILSAGLPMKILVQSDDILDESPVGDGHFGFGIRGRQLANMAISLNEVYVLQTTGSHLYQSREQILKGLTYAGPVLLSVFSGASGQAGDLSPYLTAAAAIESRAFPVFTYDPSAGEDWASRFSLSANPQVELDWPVHPFAYEDEDRLRVSQDVAFTLVDFVALDGRYAKHFAKVPRANWNGNMIPVSESVTARSGDQDGPLEKVPCLLMVDRNQTLQKVLVDERLVREARRCREIWHSLQELGGVHNSYAERQLASERNARAEQERREPDLVAPASAPLPAVPGAAVSAEAPSPAAPQEPSSDEPYIETPRCTTCNECTQINNKMFAYNENRQAYIANPDAGTYAQLVEAAESCQVSIIHPGKPRNPNEPGLDELLKRAEAFR